MTVFAHLPQMQQSTTSSSFQTEIVAVHTPQIEHPKEFPFVINQKIQRPSSLPITSSSNDSSTSTRSNTVTTNEELEALKECNGESSCANVAIDAAKGH